MKNPLWSLASTNRTGRRSWDTSAPRWITLASPERTGKQLSVSSKVPRETSSKPGVHLVMQNYGTHKVTKVRTWLSRHPRYHVHYTPTSGSWLNLVERLFAEVTERCVRRGSYTAVRSLEKAMLDYLDERNKDPTPFVWTADADLILGKVRRLSELFPTQVEFPETT